VGETVVLLHRSNAQPQRITLDAVDTLRAELECFADAVEGRRTYYMQAADMLANVAAFEATVKALTSGTTVSVSDITA
jgi:predicted dehydrogenase